MDTPSLPPQKPALVDTPPTVEYVETKRNWKKVLEICAVVVIISIPLLLSLFKFDYSVKRAYEVVNPAYIGTSSDYGTWGNIVTVAKKFIQPVIHPSEQTTQVTAPQPTATPTPSALPRANQHPQEVQQPQHSEQFAPAQDQNWVQYPSPAQENDSTPYYPADVQVQEPTAMPTPTDIPTPTFKPTWTPTPKPTSTPTPRPTVIPSPTPNNDQIDAYAAYTACYGKANNAVCSYQSAYGGTVNGKCKMTGGYLTCAH